MRTLLVGGMTLCLCVLSLQGSFAQEASRTSLERLKTEAPEVWNNVIPKYQSVEIEGTMIGSNVHPEKGVRTKEVDILLLDAAGLYLRKVHFKDKNIWLVEGESSRYRFAITKDSPDGKWSIVKLRPGMPSSAEWKKQRMEVLGEYIPLTNIHYSVWGIPLPEFFSHPAISVTQASEVKKDGRTCIHVSFTCNESNKNDQLSYMKSGEVVLCPELAWCALEHVLTVQVGPNSHKDHFTVEFHEGSADLPIPKLARRKTEPSEEYSFEFKRYVTREVSPGEVTLTAFGVPEVESNSIPGASSSSAVVGNESSGKIRFMLAFVSLGIAVVGYWMIRRRSAKK